MSKCLGFTRAGRKCSRVVRDGTEFCSELHATEFVRRQALESGGEPQPAMVPIDVLPDAVPQASPRDAWFLEWLPVGVFGLPNEFKTVVAQWLEAESISSIEVFKELKFTDFPAVWALGWRRVLMREIESMRDAVPRTSKRQRTDDATDSDCDDKGKQSVVLYKIPNKDGKLFESTDRSGGIVRMEKVQPLTRLMDDVLFGRLVTNLVFDKGAKTRYEFLSEQDISLAAGSSFRSLARLPHLYPMQVYSDSNKFVRAILLDFRIYDWTELSLLDFVIGDRPVWGRRPTWSGRDSLCRALTNVELFYRTLVHSSFSGCFAKITTLLAADEDVFKDYDDLFIWEKVERLLVMWSSDIRYEKRSRIFPSVDLSTPGGCISLLDSYVTQMLLGVQGTDVAILWEKSPHTIFYSLEGVAKKLKMPLIAVGLQQSEERAVSTPLQKGICLFEAARLLGLRRDGSGTEYKCYHSAMTCKGTHVKNISELHGEGGKKLIHAAQFSPLKTLVLSALAKQKPKGNALIGGVGKLTSKDE